MRRFNAFGLAAAAILAVAFVIATQLLANALIRTKSDAEMIRVTGSARMPIESDLIIWRANIVVNAPQVSPAYASLKTAIAKTNAYLQSKGIKADEISTSSIATKALFAPLPPGQQDYSGNTLRQVEAYELRQTVEVRSTNIDVVDKVAREATDLIAQGVPLESEAPQYLYTKISDAKVEILAEAAKDARRRAEQIAKSSGAGLGEVRFARMSPLQITPIYSNEISGEGINDTTSKQKAITAIVTMGFGVR